MITTNSVLNIFLACPNDIDAEKEILQKVVDEINIMLSSHVNARLNLLDYKNSIVPDMGAYPQAVINQQITGKFDILIGIFWTRIGTPTKNFESGSVEEIENVINFNSLHQDSQIQIMTYFKTEPINPNLIDVDQLQKLNAFRYSLSNRGVLYDEFSNPQDFEQNLRFHLTQVLLNLSSKSATFTGNDKPNIGAIAQDDNLEFLDYVEINSTETNLASQILDGFGKSLSEMNLQTNRNTGLLNQQVNIPNKDITQIHHLVNEQAKIWNLFIKDNKSRVLCFSSANNKSQNALKHMIGYYQGFENNEESFSSLKILYKALVNLNQIFQTAIISNQKVVTQTTLIPGITKDVKLAKKELIEFFNRWGNSLDEAQKLVHSNIDMIKQILNESVD